MNTGKKKDAAVLFELIDKSTLKVPKNAGALKIPSWWSSKTNPPPQGTPAGTTTAGNGVQAENRMAQPVVPTGAELGETVNKEAVAAEENPAPVPAPAHSQARLFEPPPAGSEATPSPSIRPPAPSGNAIPVTAPVSRAPAKMAGPAAAIVPVSGANGSQTEGSRRVFAPATLGSATIARRQMGAPAPGGRRMDLSKVPVWAMAAGAAGLVLLICLCWLIFAGHKTPVNTSATGNHVNDSAAQGVIGAGSNNGGTTGQGQQSLLPSSSIPGNGALQTNGNPVNGNVNPTPQAQTGPARVFESGQVQWSPDLNYLIIYTSKDQSLAQSNAEFFAAHGVNVCVQQLGSGLWAIITIEGYPRQQSSSLEELRKRVVALAKYHKDYPRNPKIFSDAYPAKVKVRPSAPAVH